MKKQCTNEKRMGGYTFKVMIEKMYQYHHITKSH